MTAVSMGVGLTNACNLTCSHCYRPRGEIQQLSREDVARALDAFDVHSLNLGTGENILSPDLSGVLELLAERGVRTSLTSNGLSLLELDAGLLSGLHDVEVSFDFPNRAETDWFRGEGAWDSAVAAVDRCVSLGLTVTVLGVLMRVNHDRLPEVARLAGRLGARFRVNVYQPVHDRKLMPTFDQLWGGFERLFAETALVTCTEPVVAAVLSRGAESERTRPTGCGSTSVRVTPDGAILPCVYWPRPAARLEDLGPGDGEAVLAGEAFEQTQIVPKACLDCPLVSTCGGGCPARRALTVGLEQRDPYCPYAEGGRADLAATWGDDVRLLRAASVCTTIVEPG